MSTKGRMMERLRVILAGRAAEEVPICAHLILHHPFIFAIGQNKGVGCPPNVSSGGAALLLSAWDLQMSECTCPQL